MLLSCGFVFFLYLIFLWQVWEIVYSKDGSVKEVSKVMQLKGHKVIYFSIYLHDVILFMPYRKSICILAVFSEINPVKDVQLVSCDQHWSYMLLFFLEFFSTVQLLEFFFSHFIQLLVQSAVTWLCFDPNSEKIITASKDGSMRLWNINGMHEHVTFLCNFSHYSFKF